ncbi:hypothetical protein, partial [Actinoplanes philippinensis]|uniref:hypothetical protein n=1 Tax=Actinoplanes philippinensis TaxID=35752 RepID=UPI0033F1A56A
MSTLIHPGAGDFVADPITPGDPAPPAGPTPPGDRVAGRDPALLEIAEEAMRLVHIDPRVAKGQALRLRAAARRAGDAGALGGDLRGL